VTNFLTVMKNVLLCLCVFISFSARAGLVAPGIFSVPSLDFNSPSEDLNPLYSMMKDAKIVALGESVHTNGSFQKANARIAKFLIEKHGFRNLLIETPRSLSLALEKYVKTCHRNIPISDALGKILPQFNSVELAALYSWVRDFNCSHPLDQVTLIGFDIQAPGLDEKEIEKFVNNKALALATRLAELRLCSPPSENIWSFLGPTDDADLQKCHQFLNDLSPFIERQISENRGDLELSVIALRYSAAMARYNEHDLIAANSWRDLGMATMIQKIVTNSPPRSKSIVIGHLMHVARDGQEIFNFASRSMGSYLNDWYGSGYFVSETLSYKIALAKWWPYGFYQPSPKSFEGTLYSLSKENLLVNVASNTIAEVDSKVEVVSQPNIIMSKYWDAVMFVPTTEPMTNYPDIKYPDPPQTAPNMNFEFARCTSTWMPPNAWSLVGKGFSIACDQIASSSTAGGALLTSSIPHDGFGAIAQCLPLENFTGTINLSGYLHSEKVKNGYAGLWMQVTAPDGITLASDDMSGHGIIGTSHWAHYEINLKVPATAAQVCFGVLLTGDGSVGVGSLNITSTSVP
jgi:erythromycin esterase-like protein